MPRQNQILQSAWKPLKREGKSDVEKLFSDFSKTRDNLTVINELLLYWNLADTDRVLDELEMVSDFGPKTEIEIVESLREDIVARKLKSGNERKEALKKNVLDLLTVKGKTKLQLGYRTSENHEGICCLGVFAFSTQKLGRIARTWVLLKMGHLKLKSGIKEVEEEPKDCDNGNIL